MPLLSISCFGTFDVRLDDQPLTAFESNKARSMLAYLAVEADRPHQRSKLASLLWPEWSETEARGHLRHVLSHTRKLLCDQQRKPPFLRVDRNTLQFNTQSSHQFDVADFNQLITDGAVDRPTPASIAHLQEAVTLYRGPFLDGFSLHDCTAFEEWLLLTRDRLHQQLIEALDHLVAFYEQQGEFPFALPYARQQVEHAPWREEAHRQLMRLLARTGQRGAALAQYEKCCQILQTELDVAPDPATVALYQQIQRGEIKPAHTGSNSVIVETMDRSSTSSSARVEPLPPNNLPLLPTPLLGRQQACADLATFLRDPHKRLVTVTGVGGVGKTRLAQQVARDLLPEFPDGVYFVPLASLQEADLLLATIAQILEVRETAVYSLLEAVQIFLNGKKLLLLLDNFEHIVSAAPLLASLLSTASHFKILVTSREVLQLQGEQNFSLSPLMLPGENVADELNSGTVDQYAALELFRQRAQSIKPGFALTQENIRDVAEICRLVDGLPLAIELAAARVKLFAPQALLRRLVADDASRSLALLKDSSRDRSARHRSLMEMIAWSYELLTPDEQYLFRRLAIFVGGCTLSGAEAVCCVDDLASGFDLLDGVTSLLDKNLLYQIEQPDGEPRLMMLETIRAFGLVCLEEMCELADAQQRHAEYFADLTKDWSARSKTAESQAIQDRFVFEIDNLRAVFRWVVVTKSVELGLRMEAELPNIWIRYGFSEEAYTRTKQLLVLAKDLPPTSTYAWVIYLRGFFAHAQNRYEEAQTFYAKSLVMSRQLDDKRTISYTLALLAGIVYEQGSYKEARSYFEEGIRLAKEIGEEWHAAVATGHLGYSLGELGNFTEGHQLCKQALETLTKIGEPWSTALFYARTGHLYYLEGNLSKAKTFYTKSLNHKESIANRRGLAFYYSSLIAIDEGEFDKAFLLLSQALIRRKERSRIYDICQALDAFAKLYVAQKYPGRALCLASAASQLRRDSGIQLPPLQQAAFDQVLEQARQMLNGSEGATAWAKGASLTLAEAVDYALEN